MSVGIISRVLKRSGQNLVKIGIPTFLLGLITPWLMKISVWMLLVELLTVVAVSLLFSWLHETKPLWYLRLLGKSKPFCPSYTSDELERILTAHSALDHLIKRGEDISTQVIRSDDQGIVTQAMDRWRANSVNLLRKHSGILSFTESDFLEVEKKNLGLVYQAELIVARLEFGTLAPALVAHRRRVKKLRKLYDGRTEVL